MNKSLIARLRSCSPGQRKFLSEELARTESNYAVRELIRMAKGAARDKGIVRIKISRLLHLHLFQNYYYPQDAPQAIIALGETKRPLALKYLRKIYRDKTKVEANEVHHSYPKAPEYLAQLLEYSDIHTESGTYTTKNQEIHNIFTGAIGKLERDLIGEPELGEESESDLE